jgi:hypothetical protein
MMSSVNVRVPDSALPDTASAPAPWDLRGSGCILLLRTPAPADPGGGDGTFAGGPGIVMFVDYAESPVGPYREVLHIPGRYRFGGRRRWSIGRIYVSTWASVVNGRRNWGIPKDRADFERSAQANGGERYTVSTDGEPVASLDVTYHGPALPLPGWLTPAGLRGLTQDYAGRRFSLAPVASGRLRMARVRHLAANPETFAEIRKADVFAAFGVPEFRMRFPVATIESAESEATGS